MQDDAEKLVFTNATAFTGSSAKVLGDGHRRGSLPREGARRANRRAVLEGPRRDLRGWTQAHVVALVRQVAGSLRHVDGVRDDVSEVGRRARRAEGRARQTVDAARRGVDDGALADARRAGKARAISAEWGSTFPHDVAGASAPSNAFRATPFADDALFALALASIDATKDAAPGKDPRFLALSLSANDYVGHMFGPDAWESWTSFAGSTRASRASSTRSTRGSARTDGASCSRPITA